ncbi:MAG: hypothetical protein ABI051_11490 [Vicinamibacterales bacterium]
MNNGCVGGPPAWRHLPLLTAGALLLAASTAQGQAPLPPVTIGAGLQTSFMHTSPEVGDGTDAFRLNSARLYVNGPVTSKIKFMFNTEYDGASSHIGVIDAVARIEASPKFNIWMGRFLPPSDRANLYGPYYSHHWAVYTDGVQDGYPFVTTGRDDGVTYWGQFGKVKVSAGAFDGESATGNADVLTAARVMVDFWDPEDGYYLNGTYYGGKNLLAVGAAVQAQSGDTASTVDFLLERKLAGGASFSVESEYANYDKLGGYDSRYGSSEGAYILASYLFGKPAGMGKVEILGKFAKATFSKGLSIANPDYDQKTSEFNLNYIIKEFNARVMFFFKNTTFTGVKSDSKQVGVGLQIQM